MLPGKNTHKQRERERETREEMMIKAKHVKSEERFSIKSDQDTEPNRINNENRLRCEYDLIGKRGANGWNAGSMKTKNHIDRSKGTEVAAAMWANEKEDEHSKLKFMSKSKQNFHFPLWKKENSQMQ